jgi:hypothetical protein
VFLEPTESLPKCTASFVPCTTDVLVSVASGVKLETGIYSLEPC